MGIFNFFRKKGESNSEAQNVPAQSSNGELKHAGASPKHLVTVYNRTIDISTPAGMLAHQILRQCEIFEDSAHIINTSNNLKTVMGRLPRYEKSLIFLAQCSDSNLTALRLNSKSQFENMYNSWLAKKPAVINKAVSRSCKAAIEHARTLKTENGQFKHIIAYCNNSLEIPGLSPESINFLLETKQDMENSLKAISSKVPKQEHKTSETEKNIHTVQVCSTPEDIPFENYNFEPYFQLVEQVEKPGPLKDRLALCEQARPVMASFVSACLQEDGELPPGIVFRDYAPTWYMRTGQWEAAASYINFCISCNAYFPENGQEELQFLNLYKRTAQIALAYISQNPGCLQSQIYKLLSGSTDKECLKKFTRYSELITKVPCGKTNRLYVAQQPQP